MSIRMPRTTTSKHLISIIIPIYNTEIFLRSCLDSVLNQTYQNWECILVNDGSSDGSYAICEAYASQMLRATLVSNYFLNKTKVFPPHAMRALHCSPKKVISCSL